MSSVVPPIDRVKQALDVSLVSFNLARRLDKLIQRDVSPRYVRPRSADPPVEAPALALMTLIWTRLEGRESIHELITAREDLLPEVHLKRSRFYELLRSHRTDYTDLLRGLGADLGPAPHGFKLFLIDDTVRAITGQQMAGASFHRIPHENRSVLGHGVVALYRVGSEKGGFIDFELKFNKRRPEKARRAGRPPDDIRCARSLSKAQLAERMLERLANKRGRVPGKPIVAFDGGYTARWFLRRLDELDVGWIAPLDRPDWIEIPELGGDLKVNELHGMLPSYRRVAGTDHMARQKWGTLPNYGKVRFVAVWWLRDGEDAYRTRVLATNVDNLSQSLVVIIYTFRWDIEVGFKNIKGPAGLKTCHRRQFADIRAELAATGLVHALLVRVQQELRNRWGFKQIARVVQTLLRALPASEVLSLLLGGEVNVKTMIPTRFRPTRSGLHPLPKPN